MIVNKTYIKCKLLLHYCEVLLRSNTNEIDDQEKAIEMKFFYAGSNGLREVIILNDCDNQHCMLRNFCRS